MSQPAPAPLPGAETSTSASLPAHYLATHHSNFNSLLLTGSIKPFVLPWSLAGSFLLPVLYLSIPHRKRPWLYRLRYLVVVLVVLLNAEMMLGGGGTSSANMAVGYVVGLVAGWGTIWGVVLVWGMRVQWEVARVAVRRRRKGEEEGEEKEGEKKKGLKENREKRKKEAVDESVEAVMDEWEYYWQPYPEEKGFLERLGWVTSLYLSFRGAGWNFAIPSIPHPPPPSDPQAQLPVDFSALLVVTKSGHHRSLTYRSFILNRLTHILISWIILDIWTLTARYDPYFVPGPSPLNTHPLPAFLSSLPPPLLSVLRSILSLFGVLSALHLYLPLAQLLSLLSSSSQPSSPLFLYPSISGSLPLSLTAFWSSFWHQSFRSGFTFPTTHLIRLGYLPPSHPLTKTIGVFIAFLLSGLMHGLGGYTSVPETTQFLGPVLFFLLQAVGIAVERVVGRYVSVARGWKRVGNVLFMVGWLHAANGLLIEDMSRSGLWLFEPVPVSPLRMMGCGEPGEVWWRWDETYIPRWYWGRWWWESGIRL